jgi:PAS domain S-box-containing protein
MNFSDHPRESEQAFRLIVESIPGLVCTMTAGGEVEFVNQRILDYTGKTIEELRDWSPLVHPDDLALVMARWMRSIETGDAYEVEHRILRADGVYCWFDVRGLPLRDREGCIVRWYNLLTDIDERKRAEEKIRQSERELRQLLNLTPLHISEFDPDGTPLYNNQTALDYYGLTLEEWHNADWHRRIHPQDTERVWHEAITGFRNGFPYEMEIRLRRKDGQYRWFLFRFNPIRDEQGHLTRWYAAATDIEDRKKVEQRLRNENVALREEIDRASMFEEIVGASQSLQTVLSRISKVAPIDSNVLITGETGTGKELVARAIHRRSRRSSRAFVSVNCAAIPRELIASELFGHEKGAFTGATQRRIGRFELAEGGTIFLDEVGELPAETQVALLRVLQEHEFERVGGTGRTR